MITEGFFLGYTGRFLVDWNEYGSKLEKALKEQNNGLIPGTFEKLYVKFINGKEYLVSEDGKNKPLKAAVDKMSTDVLYTYQHVRDTVYRGALSADVPIENIPFQEEFGLHVCLADLAAYNKSWTGEPCNCFKVTFNFLNKEKDPEEYLFDTIYNALKFAKNTYDSMETEEIVIKLKGYRLNSVYNNRTTDEISLKFIQKRRANK